MSSKRYYIKDELTGVSELNTCRNLLDYSQYTSLSIDTAARWVAIFDAEAARYIRIVEKIHGVRTAFILKNILKPVEPGKPHMRVDADPIELICFYLPDNMISLEQDSYDIILDEIDIAIDEEIPFSNISNPLISALAAIYRSEQVIVASKNGGIEKGESDIFKTEVDLIKNAAATISRLIMVSFNTITNKILGSDDRYFCLKCGYLYKNTHGLQKCKICGNHVSNIIGLPFVCVESQDS